VDQYSLFLALCPVALLGSLSVLAIPLIKPQARLSPYLAIYQYLQIAVVSLSALELILPGERETLFLAKLGSIPFSTGPVFWYLFAREFVGKLYSRHHPKKFLYLFLVPILLSLSAITNGLHGLMWKGYEFLPVRSWLAFNVLEFGPMAWVFIMYAFSLFCMGSWILLDRCAFEGRRHRIQSILMSAGVGLPYALSFLQLTFVTPGMTMYFSALYFSVCSVFLTFACLRFGLFIEPLPKREDKAEPEAELSLREAQILDMLRTGLSNKEISQRFGVSENTVKFHVKNIYRKTGVHKRSRLGLASIGGGTTRKPPE
jgi:DNA-binding CsgD family transcriptional regulator